MSDINIAQLCRNIEICADAIWRVRSEQEDMERISYSDKGHDACIAVEDSSFWFDHRNRCIQSLVTRYPPPDNAPILDVGGGNGYVACGLVEAGFDTILVEPGEIGATNAKRRGLNHVICATVSEADFIDGTVGAIGLFDVVEHIEDDLEFIRTMRELLTPKGRIYATVPAYSCLWSDEDERAGHFRRYSKKSLTRLFSQANLEVEFISYFFRPLPLPILLGRVLPYRLGLRKRESSQSTSRDHMVSHSRLATVMTKTLSREALNIANDLSMNFGGSCIVSARAR